MLTATSGKKKTSASLSELHLGFMKPIFLGFRVNLRFTDLPFLARFSLIFLKERNRTDFPDFYRTFTDFNSPAYIANYHHDYHASEIRETHLACLGW